MTLLCLLSMYGTQFVGVLIRAAALLSCASLVYRYRQITPLAPSFSFFLFRLDYCNSELTCQERLFKNERVFIMPHPVRPQPPNKPQPLAGAQRRSAPESSKSPPNIILE